MYSDDFCPASRFEDIDHKVYRLKTAIVDMMWNIPPEKRKWPDDGWVMPCRDIWTEISVDGRTASRLRFAASWRSGTPPRRQ